MRKRTNPFLFCFCAIFSFLNTNAQTYLTEDFENAFSGSPVAPTGWTQSVLYAVHHSAGLMASGTDGNKVWEQNSWTGTDWTKTSSGTPPVGPFSGTGILYMNDYNWTSSSIPTQSARIESPIMNLSSSVSPYLRFYWFNNQAVGVTMNMRAMVSPDGGTTWHILAPIVNGFTVTNATWNRINILIPPAYRTSNCKIAFEMTNRWGSNSAYLDLVTVEEFSPTTITSMSSGDWNSTATWVGGVIPSSANHVIIATGNTVTVTNSASTTGIFARCQNLTINGTIDYGTGTSNLLKTFGNITINSGGTLNAFNGTGGRMVYCGGNFTINTGGTANFSVGTTSQATSTTSISTNAAGIIFYNNQPASFTNNGTLTGGYIQNILHVGQGGFTYNSPVTCYRTFALHSGAVNPNGNLTLGNSPVASTVQTIERANGSLTSNPLWNNNNISSRNNIYYSPNWVPLTQSIITTGNEVEMVSSVRTVTGTLTLNTHNNIQLSYPLTVGTATTGSWTMTRGILITSDANLLTTTVTVSSSPGSSPGSTTPPTTHGSYVVGPIKRVYGASGSTARVFPIGLGTAFNGAIPNSNVLKAVTLSPGTAAGQAPIVSFRAPATGATIAPLTTLLGANSVRVNLDGGADFPATATLQITGINYTFGSSDNLTGTQEQLRVAQSTAVSGPWTERSMAAGSGTFVNNLNYTRTTSTGAPGPIAPIATNGEYFSFANTQSLTDAGASSLVTPVAGSCFGTAQAVVIRVKNLGAGTINFASSNLTVTCNVTGAATATLNGMVNTGTLNPGDSLNVTLTPTLNMSAFGTYTFNAFTTMPGDANATNDAMPATNVIKIANEAVAIANGNWAAPSSWCGNVVPASTDNVIIPNTFTITVNAAGALANAITIHSGGKLIVASGDLEVGPWSECGGNRVLLNQGTLQINGGTTKVAGSVNNSGGSNFVMTAGDLIIDGDGTVTKVASNQFPLTIGNGTAIAVSTVTGGKITFVDPHPTGSTTSVIYYNNPTGINTDATWTNNTIQFGDPLSTCNSVSTNNFYINNWVATGFLQFGNVIINTNGGTVARAVVSAYQFAVNGNLTVKTNSNFAPGTSACGVNENVVIEAGATATALNLYKGIISGQNNSSNVALQSSASPSSITNNGLLKETALSTCSECLTALSINANPGASVTLNSPISATTTLTMTKGVLNTSASNLLTLGIVVPASGGTLNYAEGQINGPFRRVITAITGARIFPVGTNAFYRPTNIDFTVAPSVAGTLTATFISTAPGGSGLPITDGATTINAISQIGFWELVAANGLLGGTYTVNITGTGFPGITTPAELRVVKRANSASPWGVDGNHVAGTGVTASRSGLTGFSDFAIGSNSTFNTLPVSLANLTGSREAQGNLLRWTTLNEQNNKGFELQRSVDGRTFSTIAFVQSKAVSGNSSLLISYSFTDDKASINMYYYRLRQVDLDDRSNLSNTVVIKGGKTGALTLVGVYPNPVQDKLNLLINAPAKDNFTLSVIDMYGKQIIQKFMSVESGSNNLVLDVKKLLSGTYVIKIVSAFNNESSMIQFIKQ